MPSCRRAHPRPLRTNAEVPSVWRGCFGGLRRHLRAASPNLDGHGRQGGILRGRGLGWHSAAISDLKRGETNCLGRRPPRRPAVAVLWLARGRHSIITPACQRDASLGQRGVAFFFVFFTIFSPCLDGDARSRFGSRYGPSLQQGALRRGAVMSQGHDATSKMLRPRKPPSRSISTPLVCTAGTSSASLDNRRRGSLVWAWSGCKCTAAQTLRQVSDVGSGQPHICKSGLTTLRQPFHGAGAAAYALDTVSNSLGQFSTSSCCGWRLKRTAPRA